MKTYRIVYWFNACIMTECYIKANNEQEAIDKFKDRKGERMVVNIEESN